MRRPCVVLLLFLGLGLAREARAQSQPPRWQLAAAFVKRDSVAIHRYLAPDVMVWPPAPDTARRGGAAIDYFLRLSRSATLSRSEFRPRTVSADGDYLVEEGSWIFTHGRSKASARYDLRWRHTEGKWRVSFLRWEVVQ